MTTNENQKNLIDTEEICVYCLKVTPIALFIGRIFEFAF